MPNPSGSMSEKELFPPEETISPMEEWRKRHWVGVYPTQDGFRASTPAANAHGKTREEALLAWADKAHVPCWKAEELKRLNDPQPKTP